MAEYIDKNKAIELIKELENIKDVSEAEEWVDIFISTINELPIIELNHGRWKQIVHPWYECSECGERTAVVNLNGKVLWNYCPNCGARMDEVEE